MCVRVRAQPVRPAASAPFLALGPGPSECGTLGPAPVRGALVRPRRPDCAQALRGLHLGAGRAPAPGHRLTPTPLLPQVSTHHLHPSSEDEDMEGVFPNELSLQQVGVARPFPTVRAPRAAPPG